MEVKKGKKVISHIYLDTIKLICSGSEQKGIDLLLNIHMHTLTMFAAVYV